MGALRASTLARCGQRALRFARREPLVVQLHLDLPRHLTHFTADTLTGMLQTAGFQVESLRTLRHSDWLRSSVKLSVRSGRARLTDRLLAWKPLAKFVGWWVYILGGSDCLIAVAERPKV